MKIYKIIWFLFILFFFIFGLLVLTDPKQNLSILRTGIFGILPIIFATIFILLQKNRTIVILTSNSLIFSFILISFFEINLIRKETKIIYSKNDIDLNNSQICGQAYTKSFNLPIYPLGGISEHIIKFNNTKNKTTSYRYSDRYGFNNTDQIWNNSDIHSIFIGDSFTYGVDVNYNENFVELYKKKYPKTINLGCGGNGPIIELAIFEEYVKGLKLKPNYLFWVYYSGNDLTKDIVSEKNSFYKLQKVPNKRFYTKFKI